MGNVFSVGASAAAEAHTDDPGGSPEGNDHSEVISHIPGVTVTSSLDHRSTADSAVLAEEHSGGNKKEDKEDAAGHDRAEKGTDSAAWSNISENHHNSGKAEESVRDGHKCGDRGQTRSSLLALDITVINQVDQVSDRISVKVLIEDIDLARDGNLHVPALTTLRVSVVSVADGTS